MFDDNVAHCRSVNLVWRLRKSRVRVWNWVGRGWQKFNGFFASFQFLKIHYFGKCSHLIFLYITGHTNISWRNDGPNPKILGIATPMPLGLASMVLHAYDTTGCDITTHTLFHSKRLLLQLASHVQASVTRGNHSSCQNINEHLHLRRTLPCLSGTPSHRRSAPIAKHFEAMHFWRNPSWHIGGNVVLSLDGTKDPRLRACRKNVCLSLCILDYSSN